MTDLRQAAEMLRGRKVHPRTRAIVVPATQRVYREALAEGLLDLFVEAGAMVSTPTCGACFGGSGGVLAPGENAVTTTNRNFRAGWARTRRACTSPTPGLRPRRRSRARSSTRPSWRGGMSLSGRAVVIRQDDVDTDVLYPGTYLNVTDVEQMSRYLFEGLDPSLRDQLGGDTALVVGANFGAGSSREHVPQAMAASGVRFVVGKSFARIFYRNCINLGLPADDRARGGRRGVAGIVDRARSGAAARVTVDGQAFPINAGARVPARDVRSGRPRAVDAPAA